MIYSTSLQGEKAAVDVPKFKKAMADLGVLYGRPNVSDLFPFLAWFDLQGIEKETKKVAGVAEEMLDSAIEHRRKNVNHHNQQKKDIFLGSWLRFVRMDEMMRLQSPRPKLRPCSRYVLLLLVLIIFSISYIY